MASVDFVACFVGALMLLVLPLNWLSTAFFAALFHEACHFAVIVLLGGKILGIQIGVNGAIIETVPMEDHKEFLCALAGPLGSIFLISLCRLFPRLAVCAATQGLFNLIPVYPLDGGRCLLCVLRMLCPKYAENVAGGIKFVILLAVTVLVIVITLKYSLGLFLPIFAVMLILKGFGRKIPCKQTRIGVQ